MSPELTTQTCPSSWVLYSVDKHTHSDLKWRVQLTNPTSLALVQLATSFYPTFSLSLFFFLLLLYVQVFIHFLLGPQEFWVFLFRTLLVWLEAPYCEACGPPAWHSSHYYLVPIYLPVLLCLNSYYLSTKLKTHSLLFCSKHLFLLLPLPKIPMEI